MEEEERREMQDQGYRVIAAIDDDGCDHTFLPEMMVIPRGDDVWERLWRGDRSDTSMEGSRRLVGIRCGFLQIFARLER